LKVRVSAPSRLHLGLIDPFNVYGRMNGGVGLAIDEPRSTVIAEPFDGVTVEAPYREEVKVYVERVCTNYRLPGAKVTVLTTAPRHSGLGSTTQLALAVAKAVTKAYALEVNAVKLAKVLGRGSRSGVGTYAFQYGGFIVDGGRGPSTSFPPLIARYPFPEEWRIVMITAGEHGLSEEVEDRVISSLPKPPLNVVLEASYTVLMGLIPSLLEGDFTLFTGSLSRLQRLVGKMFEAAQGGVFRSDIAKYVDLLSKAGALGVGQSSWGSTVYGFTQSWKEAEEVVSNLTDEVKTEARIVKADNEGAKVEILSC